MSTQFNNLVTGIPRLPGIERFLLRPAADEIKASAVNRPMVVFKVSGIRSNVFLIDQNSIYSLQLLSLKYEDLENNFHDFLLTLGYSRESTGGLPKCNAMDEENSALVMGRGVAVGPIRDERGSMKPPSENEEWPKVWWVGSRLLNVLPLHAAGDHDSKPLNCYRPCTSFFYSYDKGSSICSKVSTQISN